jgi:hypothetical protein
MHIQYIYIYIFICIYIYIYVSALNLPASVLEELAPASFSAVLEKEKGEPLFFSFFFKVSPFFCRPSTVVGVFGLNFPVSITSCTCWSCCSLWAIEALEVSVCMPPTLSQHSHVSIREHAAAYVSIHQHTSAYVSIRQHTSAYVRIRQHTSEVSLRENTSAYVSIRQHTPAYVRIRQHTSEVSLCEHTSAYVSIRQHTSAYVRIRQRCCCVCRLR